MRRRPDRSSSPRFSRSGAFSLACVVDPASEGYEIRTRTLALKSNPGIHHGEDANLISYKFRLYPTRVQLRILSETIETCRLLYNRLLIDRENNNVDCFSQKRAVTAIRHEDKFLKAVNAQVVQDVVFRLHKPYARFFAGLSRKPRFKRKGRYNSFTYPQLGSFKLVDGKLRLSKIGLVRVRLHRQIDGTPKTCAIVRDIDRWYACISVEGGLSKGAKAPNHSQVGVDLGILNLATLSSGKFFENPRCFYKSISRIRLRQKRLSKKDNGSHNREKARVMLAKIWQKVRNQRIDIAHKISCYLATEYSTIVFEDLRIQNMIKNHDFASAITDASWSQLRQLTAYKAERRGGRVILVNPSGTSQKCSGCGQLVPKTLSERVHDCPKCGLVVDRDVNACKKHPKSGSGAGPCGGTTSACPTQADKQVRSDEARSSKREAAGLHP